MEHIYYELANGDMISKERVDNALKLINSLVEGFNIVHLNDSDIMRKGNLIDAVKLFRDKYGCGLAEAKAAIDFLRGEDD